MQSTLDIDEELLREAERLTRMKEKTRRVRMGLETPIARERSRRLARQAGMMPGLRVPPRRRGAKR
jgi:hypothetical protein